MKWFQLFIVCLCALAARAHSQENVGNVAAADQCPIDHPCADQPTGDCWCLYTHYEPRYYCTQRCVEEKVPCQKKCCRMVPKYYEITKCRMVPEYYTETVCREEKEYYFEEDCKICKKWVEDTHCEYVPSTYWKHVCCEPNCNNCGGPQVASK